MPKLNGCILGTIVSLFFCLPGILLAEEGFRFRVKVDIRADEEIVSLISSYFRNQLRLIPDVVLVDHDPHFIIAILALNIPEIKKASSILEPRFAMSHLILKIFEHERMYVEKAFEVEEYALDFDGRHRLRERCQQIVATFDTEQLEAERTLLQKAEELERKYEERLTRERLNDQNHSSLGNEGGKRKLIDDMGTLNDSKE